MLRNWYFIILTWWLPLFVAAKPLYIEITDVQNYGIPIAVVPFKTTLSSFGQRGVDDLTTVIRADLQNSGQFKAMSFEDMDKSKLNTPDIDLGYWKRQRVDNLVTGEITEVEDGLYDIEFRLFDLYKDMGKVLAHIKFRQKSPEQFRALSHHISDLIFEKLTGVRGAFSTRISYITIDYFENETIHTLTVADADGYNDKPLVTANYPLMSPSWSPDGTKISFVSFKDNRSSIRMVEVKSGKITDLIQLPGINGSPAWSPDGKRLAVVLSKDGTPKIYLLDIKSKRLKRITHGGAIDTEPYWAPDGKSIIFTSDRGGKPQIYRVVLATGQVERLTFKGTYNATASMTADSKKLVYMHRDEEGHFKIAVQDLANDRVKLLTRGIRDESPSLAPNGMMVLYGSEEAGRRIIRAVSIAGGFKMRLPTQEGYVKEPVWSPYLM